MLVHLLLSVAMAQPAQVAPSTPITTDVGASASLLGGIDRWESGGGGSAELQLGLAGQRRQGALTARGGYGGMLQGWQGPWALDHHQAWGALQHRGGAALDASVSGSGAQEWIEGRLAPGWLVRGRKVELRVSLGGVIRSATGAVPGGHAQLWGRALLHRRLASEAWLQGRVWTDDRLPASAGAGAAVTWNPWLDLALTLRGTGTIAGPGPELAVSGLLPGDASLVRTDLEVAWWAGPNLSLLLAGGGEVGLGAAPYARYRAMGGVRASIGRTKSNREVGVSSDLVQLRLDAPDAERVEVIGDFTGWRPVPMTPGAGGWWLDLPVPPGIYEYVYVVDGESTVPPEAIERRDDGFGGTNGVLVVLHPAS